MTGESKGQEVGSVRRLRWFAFLGVILLLPLAAPAAADDVTPYPVRYHQGPSYNACVVTLPDSPNVQGMGSLSGLRVDAGRNVLWSHTDNRTYPDDLLRLYQFEEVSNPEINLSCPNTFRHKATYTLKDADGNDVTRSMYDLEGIEVDTDGTLWMTEEQNNKVLKVSEVPTTAGTEYRITQVINPPSEFMGTSQGFEGIAVSQSSSSPKYIFITQQIQMDSDPTNCNCAYILRYNMALDRWAWWRYPLELPDPGITGHRLGLHDALWIHRDNFGKHYIGVIERDNQSGTLARAKRLYVVGVGAASTAQGYQGALTKILASDLITDYGYPHEKPEGLSFNLNVDQVLVVDDNVQTGTQEIWRLLR